ncbi:MAG TPA: polyhydroxyalkanoate depolymerase [Stellaceae bacterium]|nr:polyhydroxyalkanoate depolymerase [Stellaceae bacterium]
MLYQYYQGYADSLAPLQSIAAAMGDMFARPWLGLPRSAWQRGLAASCRMFAEGRLQHRRPEFGIDSVTIGNAKVPVTEEKIRVTPFSTLLHFANEAPQPQPRVLLVAPMSGHFATLLRHTVRTMLPEHDIYITDWHNARDVPLSAGDFDFDDFIDHVIQCLEIMGPGSHVVAVCQPVVAVLAAVALMAQSDHPCQPRSMTLMAGPIDTRIKPTKVDDLAMEHPIEWFETNLISRVPACHAGAHRRVYPGFLQISAFMAMNLERHVRAFGRQFESLVDEDDKGIAAHRAFYDEYFAVMDLPAPFYLQTVERIFQKHELARGVLVSRDRKVEPAAIQRTALLTIEGENDDICAVGQTLAAQELCTSIAPMRRGHHLQTGVGHYGVFSGRRWAGEIYPRVRDMIWANN